MKTSTFILRGSPFSGDLLLLGVKRFLIRSNPRSKLPKTPRLRGLLGVKGEFGDVYSVSSTDHDLHNNHNVITSRIRL